MPHEDSDLEELMRRDAVSSQDKLEALAKAVRGWRDVKLEVSQLEERLEDAKSRLRDLERQAMPELFASSGVDRVDVPADGNFPAATAELKPFYRAAIPVGWDRHQKELAFAILTRLGLESIIKPTVVISFDRAELAAAKKLVDEMIKRHIPAELDQRVNHQTLTSAVKDLCESGLRPGAEVLSTIGAEVGRIVKVKLVE